MALLAVSNLGFLLLEILLGVAVVTTAVVMVLRWLDRWTDRGLH